MGETDDIQGTVDHTATKTVMSEIYEQSNIFANILDLFVTHEIRSN